MLTQEQGDPLAAKAYVLKTFHPRRGSEAQWDHEVEAHVALRSALRRDPGIIWFHHCYTHGKTCNVILELAPLGDLEDVLHNLQPPKSREDTMLFWRSFLRLLETLAYLRELTYQDKSAYQLCHFDLKPQNILVCEGRSGSPYDLHFKIGDFGSSNFCVLRNDSDTYAEYYPGTRTFGAPECYNWNPFSDTTRTAQKVLPDADMWSLGAIALEIAEWMRSGPTGIAMCRQWRRTAHQYNPRFKVADCFHDGKDVLECVETHMDFLINDCDPENATGSVVRLIRDHMLVADPKARMAARLLQIEADNALNAVRRQWDSTPQVPSSQTSAPYRRATDPPSSTHKPTDRFLGRQQSYTKPTLPLREQINGWPFDERSQSPPVNGNGAISSSMPLPSRQTGRNADIDTAVSYAESSQPPGNGPSALQSSSPIPLGSKNPFRNSQRVGQTPVIYPDPDILANRSVDSTVRDSREQGHRPSTVGPGSGDAYSSRALDGFTSDPSRERSELPIQDVLGLDSANRAVADPFWSDVGQSNIPQRSSRWSPTHNSTTAETVQPPIPIDPKHSTSQVSHYTEEATSDTPRSPSSTIADNAAKPRSKRHSDVEVLGLDEAQERLQSAQKYKSKLKRFSWRYKPEPGKLEQYLDRDFIILVDDSTSMHAYWPKVVDCAKFLADYTTPYDDNGIELRFLRSFRSKKVTKDPDLIKSLVDNNKPPRNGDVVITQITKVFEHVLGEYRKNLEAKPSMKDRVFGKKEKKLIVFVLTDGETCVHYDARSPIFDLVATLRSQKRDTDHVGIQFVQFGDDERAGAKLAELDNFLDPRSNTLLAQDVDNKDIVDVERWWDGVNVWKLLLGSIDKRFDHADSPEPSTPIQRTMSPIADPHLQSPTFGGGPVVSSTTIPISREGSKDAEQRRSQYPPYSPQQYGHG